MQIEWTPALTPPSNRPSNLKEAAEAFEALFIGQMLKMARETNEGGGPEQSGQAESAIKELAEEHLAQQIAKNGGLGFARLITGQLDRPNQAVHETGASDAADSSDSWR